jgi:hypothetical protein
MKTSKNLLIAAATLMTVSLASHAATTVFTDTFDSGTGAWHKAGTLGTLTNASGQLSWTEDTATGMGQVIGRSFSTQTIDVGQSIEFTFAYTRTAGNLGVLRVGMFNLTDPITSNDWANDADNAWSGYYTFIRDNGTNLARVHNQSGMAVPGGGTGTDATLNGPTFAGAEMTVTSGGATNTTVGANTQYQGSYLVTRTATGIETLFTLSDGVTTLYSVAANTTTTFTNFNTVAMRVSEGTVLFDNVQVTFIPEPSAALLGGLGLLALLRRRR